MKYLLFVGLIGFSLSGCKKEKPIPLAETKMNYYESDGNFMIFVVDDSLELAYEYNLQTIQLSNDLLPLIYESVLGPNGMYNYNYWKLQPNNDTLFWTYGGNLTFLEELIDINDLETSNLPSIPESNQFQIIGGNPNINILGLWDKVSSLEIVKEYRNSSPNSKIGILSQVVLGYDDATSLSFPVMKHFIFISK